MTYTPKTEEEIKQIAIDIHSGVVFTSNQVKNPLELHLVFMPLVFDCFAELSEEEKKDIGLLYENLNKAGPGSCNGLPNFMSFKYLNKEDTKKVWNKLTQVIEILKSL